MGLEAGILFSAFLAAAAGQITFCDKYANLTAQTQADFINGTVIRIITSAGADPATAAWFDGTNNYVDYHSPEAGPALQNLTNRYCGYIGVMLGCTDPSFSFIFPLGTVNMNAVHAAPASLRAPIPKLAFERFNQLFLSALREQGIVDNDDLHAVSEALDAFRSPTLNGGVAVNQICQADDCMTPPFGVLAEDSWFNPSHVSIPPGGSVHFTLVGTASHVIMQSPNVSGCAVTVPGAFAIDFTSGNVSGTGPLWRSLAYIDQDHCQPNQVISMWGTIAVVGAASTVPFMSSLMSLLLLGMLL